jgi:hypothetical protein
VPTCARLFVTGRPQSAANDIATVAWRKRLYVHGIPAAPLLRDLPFGGGPARCQGKTDQASCGQCTFRGATVAVRQTDLERYMRMQSMSDLRLVPGNSGIHGMGMFTRAPIRQGDWIIEYVGVLKAHLACTVAV